MNDELSIDAGGIMGTGGNSVKSGCIRVQRPGLDRKEEVEAGAAASAVYDTFSLHPALCFPSARCTFNPRPATGEEIGCRASECSARTTRLSRGDDMSIAAAEARTTVETSD